MKIQEEIIAPSEYLEKLMMSFHEDKKKITIALDQINSETSNRIKKFIDLAANSYSVYVEPTLFEEVERTSSMVCGPSFTSETFPRPIDSDGNLMFPILQFNLSWINIVCARDYEPGLLQLWWSAAKSEHKLRFIPSDQVKISQVTNIELTREMISAVQDWGIPDEWMRDEMDSAYVFIQCLPNGITYPEFEDLCREFLEENEIDSDYKELLYKISSGQSYSARNLGALFDLFGNFNSPFDDLGFGGSILSTGQWCGGMMTANLYAYQNKETGKHSFDFDWGR
jgi:hypothetical protein